MVFVEEADRESRQQVANRVGRVLATYPAALLAEATDDQLQALEGEGFVVEVQEDATFIKLRSVHFDTTAGAPPTAVGTRKAVAAEVVESLEYWLVQFVGPVKPEWTETITALGGQLHDYVPVNAFLVQMTVEVQQQVQALDFVSWVGLYRADYKISPLLMGSKEAATRDTVATRSVDTEHFKPDPRGNLTVLVYSNADLAVVAERVEELGGIVVGRAQASLRVSLDPERIEPLARTPQVKWIEPYLPPKLHNDVASAIMGVRPVWETHGLDGEGQIVAVADTGLDTGVDDGSMSPEFRGRIVQIHSWPIPPGYRPSLNNPQWDDGAADKDSGHGTHVAGSVLGSGARSGGAVRGIAYCARLVFQAVEQWADWKRNSGNADGYYLLGVPEDVGQLFSQAYEDGARIHSNSWGDSLHGQYTADAQAIDQFLWDHKDMVILFSAGNDGVDANQDGIVDADSLASQACAKNCIAVGASESHRERGGYNPGATCSTYGGCWPRNFPVAPLRNDRLADNPEGMVAFSSRGPTDDGRIKPDVVAPGTNILSVRSSQAQSTGWGLLPASDPRRAFYMFMGGTSMATPLVAGAVALMRQYLEQVMCHRPSGALLKALLLHGAAPLAGQYQPPEVGPAPDHSQGWGRANVQRALFPDYPVHWEFRDNPDEAVGTGEVRSYQFQVATGAAPLRATLVYTDLPGSPSAGGGTVNRLRLSVVAPDGTVTQGAPANNNVQAVNVDQPQTGTYTVRVTGLNVVSQASAGAKQDFALVVSGGLEFVDLYVRDDETDDGVEPRAVASYRSPDIWVSAVPDPAAPALANAEPGRTNYVFVRVFNRGSVPVDNAEVRLYWARLGTNPASRLRSVKSSGATGLGQRLAVPAHTHSAPGEAVTAAFAWTPPPLATAKPNAYCLLATVSHAGDPLRPVDGEAARWEDNLAWRNVAAQTAAAGAEASFPFYVSGSAAAPTTAALRIDCATLPAGSRVRLKLPCRYLQGATTVNLRQAWQSPAAVSCRLEVMALGVAELLNVGLKAGENPLWRLEVLLPPSAAPGQPHLITVQQSLDGQTTGRITLSVSRQLA